MIFSSVVSGISGRVSDRSGGKYYPAEIKLSFYCN
jgi:hypothetical protein